MSVIIFYNCQIDAIKIKGKGRCNKKLDNFHDHRSLVINFVKASVNGGMKYIFKFLVENFLATFSLLLTHSLTL